MGWASVASTGAQHAWAGFMQFKAVLGAGPTFMADSSNRAWMRPSYIIQRGTYILQMDWVLI